MSDIAHHPTTHFSHPGKLVSSKDLQRVVGSSYRVVLGSYSHHSVQSLHHLTITMDTVPGSVNSKHSAWCVMNNMSMEIPPCQSVLSWLMTIPIVMHHASCIMHHESCIMHHASCIMHHASYMNGVNKQVRTRIATRNTILLPSCVGPQYKWFSDWGSFCIYFHIHSFGSNPRVWSNVAPNDVIAGSFRQHYRYINGKQGFDRHTRECVTGPLNFNELHHSVNGTNPLFSWLYDIWQFSILNHYFLSQF